MATHFKLDENEGFLSSEIILIVWFDTAAWNTASWYQAGHRWSVLSTTRPLHSLLAPPQTQRFSASRYNALQAVYFAAFELILFISGVSRPPRPLHGFQHWWAARCRCHALGLRAGHFHLIDWCWLCVYSRWYYMCYRRTDI
jgi:hypothetical protein